MPLHSLLLATALVVTGVGEDANEATADGLGRLVLALHDAVAALDKSAPPEPADQQFTQTALAKKTEVVASLQRAATGSGVWSVKVTFADGARRLVWKLERGARRDELGQGEFQIARGGAGVSDLLDDLASAHIAVQTQCERARCEAKITAGLAREPAARPADEKQPAPPDWVSKGSGVFAGDKGTWVQAVGVAGGARNAESAARRELRKVVQSLLGAAGRSLGLLPKTLPEEGDPVRGLAQRASLAGEWAAADGTRFALVRVGADELEPLLGPYGLAGDHGRAALQDALREAAGH